MRSVQEKLALIIFSVSWLLAAVDPYNRKDWLLENLLVFLIVIILVATYRRFRFSMVSYWCFCLFICLHLLGSHYTYSLTPVGFWVQDIFELSRNHYDRIVHFSFGLLIFIPAQELLKKHIQVKENWAGMLSISLILSFSALYELVEMFAALIVSPELGMAFLGTQGDIWDAQKDSGLALLGAFTCFATISLYTK